MFEQEYCHHQKYSFGLISTPTDLCQMCQGCQRRIRSSSHLDLEKEYWITDLLLCGSARPSTTATPRSAISFAKASSGAAAKGPSIGRGGRAVGGGDWEGRRKGRSSIGLLVGRLAEHWLLARTIGRAHGVREGKGPGGDC